MGRFNTKAFRERHALTQKDLAELIPVAIRTVERWEQETGRLYDPSPLAVHRMRAIDEELTKKKAVRRRPVEARESATREEMPSPPSVARRGVLPSVQ